MADVITRFKLETTQYDSKLRDTSKGLAEFTRQATQAGNEFGKFTQKNVEAARALGTITPSATNAKDKVKELVGAFNDAARAYNALTKEQQQSDFGKAMAESIKQLNDQLKVAKQELYGVGDVLNKAGGGGLFGGLGDKMSGALQVFAGNMLTKAAGAVANLGSEMYDMVQQGVELAKQGEGIRIAFERLGRGDILDGLREATHGTVTDLELMKAAVKFNDFKLPLDELGTMLAFAQQKAKDTGQSVDYLVESIVTGLGRKSLMILDNLGLSATEVKDKMKETGDMTKAVGEIIREQMAKAGDYVETAADRAEQANVSLQNKMEELGRKFAPLEEASSNFWTSMKIGILDVIGGPLTNLLNKLTEAGRLASQYGLLGGSVKVGRMTSNLANASEGNRQSIYQQQQAQFWKYINPREQQIKDIRAWQSGDRNEALQKRISAITEKYGSLDATKIQAEVDAAKKMLAEYQQSAKNILQPIEQKIVPTVVDSTGGGKGWSGSGTTAPTYAADSIAAQQALVSELTKQWNEAGAEVRNSYIQPLVEAEAKLKTMKDQQVLLKEQAQGRLLEDKAIEIHITANVSDSIVQSIDDIREKLKSNPIVIPIESSTKDVKALQDTAKTTAKVVGTIGQAFNAIEDPAAKVASVVAQAIANVALAYSDALAKTTAEKFNIWSFIAAAAASTVSMVSTIASIHSATGYAQGGMIKGNSYSGDNIGGLVDGSQLVGLNAGEIVLNAAGQSNVAANLRGGAMSGMRLKTKVKGTELLVWIDNSLAQAGRGELVTWGL